MLRAASPARSAELLVEAVTHGETLGGFRPVDRVLLRAAARVAPRAPRLVMPLVHQRVRAESQGVILPAERRALDRHLARRAAGGYRVNVNVLGEAVLGAAEAGRRLDAVVAQLADPHVQCVSVKISAVVHHLDPLSFEDSVERIGDRLRVVLRAAAASDPPKLVNLDMEEYRDLALTVASFTAVLDEPEFERLTAGLALQAYLPDAHEVFCGLQDWAIARHRRTGGVARVRLVKGANLAMERVDAELHRWTPAPYASKAEVDASFKRLVDQALDPESVRALRIGVASHNLFDLAWATCLAEWRGVTEAVELEMLEGMAAAEAATIREDGWPLLLYAPVTRRDDFTAAVAYLVRRLDENTGPENFLRASFSLAPGSTAFEEQADRFAAAVAHRANVAITRRRARIGPPASLFANEPDGDYTRAEARAAVRAAIAAERLRPPERPEPFSVTHVDTVVATARAALGPWTEMGTDGRAGILLAAGRLMSAQRAETIARMVVEAAKTVGEADPEVSEAVDMARYYPRQAGLLASEAQGVEGRPLGVVVVAPPWNFPYAIPAGGVLAALVAGNTVVLKPAPETVGTSHLLARQLWEAGVPRDVLQFLPCEDGPTGRHLITHDGVDAVVLTGAYDTAKLFAGWKPSLRLFAETSGKNAMVITAAADIDLAVRDLVHSAFGHAGQKCSAASLAIVEAAVLDHPSFLRQLVDAVTSLEVGPSWDLTTRIAPLIRPPGPVLSRALGQLEPGESWLVRPRQIGDDPRLWSPGVKLGVVPGSWSHRTEWFGPVLGIMRSPDLGTAIAWQNDVEFGLTAGLHSLSRAECDRWVDEVQAGNLYVNRHTTGAVVERQPFGGWKHSAFGASAKAGGPDYLRVLQYWVPTGAVTIDDARRSFSSWWERRFSQNHDPAGLGSERNVLRYRPFVGGIGLRASADATDRSVELAVLAAATVGADVTVSCPTARPGVAALVESDEACIARLRRAGVGRVRALGSVSDELRRAALDAGITVDDTEPVPDGRIELARWLQEQSVSVTTHRHGNPGTSPVPRSIRSALARRPPQVGA